MCWYVTKQNIAISSRGDQRLEELSEAWTGQSITALIAWRERGMEKGSGRCWEPSEFNQTNIGTVSRATLGRLLGDGVESVWAFPSPVMPSWAENETETLRCSQSDSWHVDRLVGLVVKASASRVEDPRFESRLHHDFSGVESYQWLKNWHSSGYPARCLAL